MISSTSLGLVMRPSDVGSSRTAVSAKMNAWVLPVAGVAGVSLLLYLMVRK
jgi:hypothetical protein